MLSRQLVQRCDSGASLLHQRRTHLAAGGLIKFNDNPVRHIACKGGAAGIVDHDRMRCRCDRAQAY